MKSNYDKHPYVAISSSPDECSVGWQAIWNRVGKFWRRTGVLCIECYPGVMLQDIERSLLAAFPGIRILNVSDCYRDAQSVTEMLARELTTDRVFGRITSYSLFDLMDPVRVADRRRSIRLDPQNTVVIGTGAFLIEPQPEALVYADLARWEIQQRQRRGLIGSLGSDDAGGSAAALYKRAFFVDWRLSDRLKQRVIHRIDWLLDTNQRDTPKLIAGEAFRSALASVVRQPFRVVPFFDPGPWGGQWMRRVCDLPDGPPNYAWCFDCVPEENSLLLGFGQTHVEVPAQDLLLTQASDLLGDAVYGRFGANFPIRYDFLDTMGGGNLSLQVHPLTEYIQEHFGMHYTQDESYYMLDVGEEAFVYLGFREGIDSAKMTEDLHTAQSGGCDFPAERYVNQFRVRRHDHVSIPAGTIHCSGKNSMVLEISATPYIFTFKLWDWGRLGLDGKPRPIHLEHGIENLRWERDTSWVRRELLTPPQLITQGEGWKEERTGLHAREFIETRRHWFTGLVPHHTNGNVQVLNLVEGEEAVVESPDHAFDPFPVHYAETFIVPASVGSYTIRPSHKTATPYATVKAYVRASA